MTPEALNERFGIPGAVTFEEGNGGQTRMRISAGPSEAEIYLLGGHVTSWKPAGGDPVLWVSRESRFAIGQPIRGGVPICHPWFGAKADGPAGPQHGYVRLMEFDVESVSQEADGSVVVVLCTKFSMGNANWPGNFELRSRVTVGETLSMALETLNCGQEDLLLTEALHSYFRVSDVRNVSIAGLAGCGYVDKVAGGEKRVQGNEPLLFAGETDRAYLNTQAECVLADPGMGRAIHVAKSGSNSTVVWTPWEDKARRLPDFAEDQWAEMVCIETANALDDAVTVPPGETHTMAARIRVEPAGGGAPRGAGKLAGRAETAGGAPAPDGTAVTARIYVAAHPARVFEAWATAPGLCRWLLASAEFRAPGGQGPRPDGAARAGDTCRWTWRAGDSAAEGRVLAADWPDTFAFTVGRAGTCRVSLTAAGPATLVEVTESDVLGAATRAECSSRWAFRLTNLKSFLEGGVDLREADPLRKGVVNG